jgi:membrane-bound lytic murein transglycosylase A
MSWDGYPGNRDGALGSGSIVLQRMAFAEIPGWGADDHAAAADAFLKSCGPVLASGSADEPLAALCRHTLDTRPLRASARSFFETEFEPYRLKSEESGFVTGYYEPILEGSRRPDDTFTIPVYRRPPELVNLANESLRGARGPSLTHARRTALGLEPYYTRQEIESGALCGRGLELLYLADPVEAFFVHVQGSAQIRLRDDRTTVRLSYDGKNGHPYRSIGRHLIAIGALRPEEVDLESLARWLRAGRERGRHVMWHNPSFVFFREQAAGEDDGPFGSLDIPLSPGRSLAVDASIHALGLPIYVLAPTLRHASAEGHAFGRLMVAQDVGSAITGPQRGDIFFGSGAEAGRLAGITKHPARFIVLLPKAGVERPV